MKKYVLTLIDIRDVKYNIIYEGNDIQSLTRLLSNNLVSCKEV
ncbi:hypothetical protein QCM11_19 [Bacillus phage QCM11]|nr:hypothetical protein H3008_gp19 [Bacillus phage QCM11]AOZ62228.1 hypothetical protein QCM11_19 [Bacillus phage QCM11]